MLFPVADNTLSGDSSLLYMLLYLNIPLETQQLPLLGSLKFCILFLIKFLSFYGKRQNYKMVSKIPVPGLNALCNALPLSVGKTCKYDEISLL